VTDLSREIIVVHGRILFSSVPLSPIMMPLLRLQDAQVPIFVNRYDPLVGRANNLKSLQFPVAAEIRLGQFRFVLADVVNHSAPIMVNTSMIHCRANFRHGDAPPAHLFFRMERKAKPPDEYCQWRPLDFWTVTENRKLIASVHFCCLHQYPRGKTQKPVMSVKTLEHKREMAARTGPKELAQRYNAKRFMSSPGNVTRLLAEISKGDATAQDRLIDVVYDELHRVAAGYMRRERPDHTLQATALVHEAYLRLVPQDVSWPSRGHFLAIAAKQMRRILLDHARRKRAARREGERRRLSLDDAVELALQEPQDLIFVDEALTALAQEHGRKARIVELRFFGGRTEEEISKILGISVETVRRDWRFSKAWSAAKLRQALIR